VHNQKVSKHECLCLPKRLSICGTGRRKSAKVKISKFEIFLKSGARFSSILARNMKGKILEHKHVLIPDTHFGPIEELPEKVGFKYDLFSAVLRQNGIRLYPDSPREFCFLLN
jgi:hypothetical protein